MEKRLFIVANRLPLTVEIRDGHPVCRQSSGGLISSITAYLARGGQGQFQQRFWVGVPSCDKLTWQQSVNDGPADFEYLPVFSDPELYEMYYDGFSNSLLWPLFHYFPSYAKYNELHYSAYIEVNERFADRLLQKLRASDVVWIHDYHLLPLAGILRERLPGLMIGFFLHIPFPAFEIFRLLPRLWQKELLTGMLGADLLGFHTAEYCRYFRDAVRNRLGIAANDDLFDFKGRVIKTDVFPVGIDFEAFNGLHQQPDLSERMTAYSTLKGDKKMLFSVDRLDYTKGIHHRVQGYKAFLNQYPEYIGRVIFVLVIVPSRHHIEKYAARKRLIDEYIGDLNSSLGTIEWKPVIYQYQHLEFADLLALYRSCDIALITPLRDGMNLVAKEFVASRNDGRGVLILSEMAGAATELNGALLINPNDSDEIASAIKLGLKMDLTEQQERLTLMQSGLRLNDVNAWATRFLNALETVKALQRREVLEVVDSFIRSAILSAYAHAQKRLLLLDYDGTLVPLASRPEQAAPSRDVLDLLAQLAADERNDIYIVSGRDGITLENWLGHLPISLIAEHGAKFREPAGNWQLYPGLPPETCWQPVEELMEHYTEQCPHSFIEHKEFARAWHFRESAPFHANRKAQQLELDLLTCIKDLPLKVLRGHKVIEVRGKLIGKGLAITNLVKENYDLILCIGDDETDEEMFQVLRGLPNTRNFKVGDGASFADYRLFTPYQVHSLLASMVDCQKQDGY